MDPYFAFSKILNRKLKELCSLLSNFEIEIKTQLYMAEYEQGLETLGQSH